MAVRGRPEDYTAVTELTGAVGTLTGAAGALLTERLLAAAGDIVTVLGAVGTLTQAGLGMFGSMPKTSEESSVSPASWPSTFFI